MKKSILTMAVIAATSFNAMADQTPNVDPEWGTGKVAELLQDAGLQLTPKQKDAYIALLTLAQTPEARETIARSMIVNNITARDIEKHLLDNSEFVIYGLENGLVEATVDKDGNIKYVATDKLESEIASHRDTHFNDSTGKMYNGLDAFYDSLSDDGKQKMVNLLDSFETNTGKSLYDDMVNNGKLDGKDSSIKPNDDYKEELADAVERKIGNQPGLDPRLSNEERVQYLAKYAEARGAEVAKRGSNYIDITLANGKTLTLKNDGSYVYSDGRDLENGGYLGDEVTGVIGEKGGQDVALWLRDNANPIIGEPVVIIDPIIPEHGKPTPIDEDATRKLVQDIKADVAAGNTQKAVDTMNEKLKDVGYSFEIVAAGASGTPTLTMTKPDGTVVTGITAEQASELLETAKEDQEKRAADRKDAGVPIAPIGNIVGGDAAKAVIEYRAQSALTEQEQINELYELSGKNASEIEQLWGEVDRLDEKMDSVMAGTHAINNARPFLSGEGQTAVGVGVGYAGESGAVAIGAAHSFTENWSASATLNVTTGSYSEVSGGAGVQYVF